MPEKRYLIGDSRGWLKVKLEPSGQIVSLIEYLQVEFIERRARRDHFRILEGVYKDKLASVAQKSASESHLGKPLPAYGSAADLEVSISDQELKYSGKTVPIVVSSSSPPSVGTHRIQIPDFPHTLGSTYLSQTNYALNWFFLGVGRATASNDRYLHPGRVSAGCVTVDPSKWTELYRYLIQRRSGDGKSIGSVRIRS
jgi:hypothetical protein